MHASHCVRMLVTLDCVQARGLAHMCACACEYRCGHACKSIPECVCVHACMRACKFKWILMQNFSCSCVALTVLTIASFFTIMATHFRSKSIFAFLAWQALIANHLSACNALCPSYRKILEQCADGGSCFVQDVYSKVARFFEAQPSSIFFVMRDGLVFSPALEWQGPD